MNRRELFTSTAKAALAGGAEAAAQAPVVLAAAVGGAATAAATGAFVTPATAQQQTTGIPGSPSATTTIDGRYLPPPSQPFQGQIELNALESRPAWPARVVPPKGAPNVLLILLDDVGFGAPSTFGGVI